MQLRAVPFLFAFLLGSVFLAHAQPPDVNSPEVQGHTDRISFETWLSGLTGDQRRGADFWAQERSKPKPISCLATDSSPAPAFVAGCQEAQSRLALPDVRRRTEPDYRKGWNADVAIAEQSRPGPAHGTPQAGVDQSDASNSGFQVAPPLAAQSEKTDQASNQVFSSAIGLQASQIEAAYPGTDCSGDMCEFATNRTPQPFCPKVGPCDKLTLFIKDGKIVGYIAHFGFSDWARSLNTSIALLGKPKTVTREHLKYWAWQIPGSFDISYTFQGGTNIYGAPIDDHSIMVEPSVDEDRQQ